jgi:hypothetical protein
MDKDVEILGCHHCHQDYACNTLNMMDMMDLLQTKLCLPILPEKEPFAECKNMIPILETADISTSSPNCTFESTTIKLSFYL